MEAAETFYSKDQLGVITYLVFFAEMKPRTCVGYQPVEPSQVPKRKFATSIRYTQVCDSSIVIVSLSHHVFFFRVLDLIHSSWPATPSKSESIG